MTYELPDSIVIEIAIVSDEEITSEEDMQRLVDAINEASRNYGAKVRMWGPKKNMAAALADEVAYIEDLMIKYPKDDSD